MYVSSVDSSGHFNGPLAPETRSEIVNVDTHGIRRLLDGLTRMDMRHNVNIVIVSDHGMTQIDE